jgi:DNA-binding MarR family transcriptional regulator
MSNEFSNNDVSLHVLKTYQVGAMESAAHRAMRQYKDALLAPYNITGIEWYLVGTVADAGEAGARITDLADALGTTQGFITKTVNLLEAKNILRRKANAKDARSSFVIMNKSYMKTLDEIETMLRKNLNNSIYGQVTHEQLKTYIQVINTFRSIS